MCTTTTNAPKAAGTTLSVAVWPTNFASSTERVDFIKINDVHDFGVCNPGEDNGNAYFTCLDQRAVDEAWLDASGQQTVTMDVSASVGCCAKDGNYLDAKVQLCSA